MAIAIQSLLRYFSPEAPPPAATAPPPQGRGLSTGGFSIIDDTGNQAKFGYRGYGPLKEKRGFIIHHTGPYPKNAGADFVEKIFGQRKFPAQYVIDRQGNIHRAVTEGQRGQHIRSGSKWTPLGKKLGLSNENTEGVEIMAADDSDVTPQQVKAASWLAQQLGYRPDQIFGHGEINSHKMHNEGMTAVRAIRANGFSQPAQPQPTPQSPSRFSMPTVDDLVKAFLPNQANASTAPAPRPKQQTGGLHPNVIKAYDFYVGKGLSPHQAAGVVGSMMQESGPNLDPNAKNPSSGAYGIAQWLGTRKTGVLGVGGKGNLDAQLDYSWRELTGSEQGALSRIQKAGSYQDAAVLHRQKYERPREDEARDDKRINYASQVYSTLGGNAAPRPQQPPASAAPTPAPALSLDALANYFSR